MPGPIRSFNSVPDDAFITGATRDFLAYLLSVANQSQAALFPLAAPTVTTISHPNAVQILWNEITGATSYAIFESAVASAPPGVPVTTIPANHGAVSNSYLRASINDTAT